VTTTDPRPAEATLAWCRAEPVLWRRTLGGVVVLSAHGPAEPMELRGPAAGIWELLTEPMTTAELVATLAATYGIEAEQVAGDVGGALETLLELGALCRS
jgi:Coenzyme PQQ synthesis protein D (PqqD)